MKCIFITGAGAGIGRAAARLFVSRGWFVGAADRDSAALEVLQKELGAEQCAVFTLDVMDPVSVTRALEEFTARTDGRLDVLHNNAGVLAVGRFEEITMAEHRKIVDVNVVGAMNVLHAAFPWLRDTEGALVVNMSSASAAYGIPDFASYSASKHAVRALTEALDIEWEPHGIRVCDLMPPFVNTGMVQANESGSRLFDQLGINLTPEEVADALWEQVQNPQLHRPVSLQFRALWPVARSAPGRVTRAVLKRLWKG